MRDCKADSEVMLNEDWNKVFPYQCYFYPGRDCPGWEAGGTCGRIGDPIPANAGSSDE